MRRMHDAGRKMIFSRTSQYAIQALVFLATHEDDNPVLVKEIARKLNIPAAYLSKILGGMRRAELLYSARGCKGGFVLDKRARETSLFEVLTLCEGEHPVMDCLLGFKACSDQHACPLHSEWKPVKDKVIAFLQEQTLVALADDVRSGKYSLADLPHMVSRELRLMS